MDGITGTVEHPLLSATMPQLSSSQPLSWRQALARPLFLRALLVAVLAGVALVVALPHFFQWIEGRPGVLVRDPVLARWGPLEVSNATFAVLYGTLLIVLATIARFPLIVLRGAYAYILMVLLRMGAMAFFTLEPPPNIIPLVDPFTQGFYPGNTPFLKDLFFSGHTATLALMVLLARTRAVRWLAGIGTAIVGALVLVQHVHWTVDVLAALPAAWIAWRAAGAVLRYTGLPISSEGA